MEPSNVRKNKETIECEKSTVICDVGTAQCADGTINCEKKIKGTTECEKSTVTCVSTYMNHVRNICHLELANPLTKHTLFVIR